MKRLLTLVIVVLLSGCAKNPNEAKDRANSISSSSSRNDVEQAKDRCETLFRNSQWTKKVIEKEISLGEIQNITKGNINHPLSQAFHSYDALVDSNFIRSNYNMAEVRQACSAVSQSLK